MIVQLSLIGELMLHKFELGSNAVKATKITFFVKGEVDHRTNSRWFKKFHTDCKELDNQARSDCPKAGDPEAVLQTVDPAINNQRVSGDLGISQSNVAHQLYLPGKGIWNC